MIHFFSGRAVKLIRKSGEMLFFLIYLFIYILIAPYLYEIKLGIIALDLLMSFIFLSAIPTMNKGKPILIKASILGGLALLLVWIVYFLDFKIPALNIIALLSRIIFLLFLIKVIFTQLFQSDTVDENTIMGALAVYLLIGLCFSYIHYTIYLIIPGSYIFNSGDTIHSYYDFIYYSYVTLTTLGFGDISPVRALAKSFSIIESIFGVVYMATVIARFVSIYTSKRN